MSEPVSDGLPILIRQPVRNRNWHLLFYRFVNVEHGDHGMQFYASSSPSKPNHPQRVILYLNIQSLVIIFNPNLFIFLQSRVF